MRKELMTSILFFTLLFSKDNKKNIEEPVMVDKSIVGYMEEEICPYENALEVMNVETQKSIGLIRKR